MAEILLFHHAQGQTPGFHAFADELRQAGHTVHTPDLFDGQTFGSIEEGLAHVEAIGWDEFIAAGTRFAERLPDDLVYSGFSLGVLPAQKLAQTRPGARAAIFFSSCVPAEEFGRWPEGLPIQVHGMDNDPFFVGEGDVDAAGAIVESVDKGELHLYAGDEHYFADSSLPGYDEHAARLLMKRVLTFLDGLD